MKLSTRAVLTGGLNHLVVLGTVLGLNLLVTNWAFFGVTSVLVALWLRYASWINKHWLFPLQIRYTRCYHCRWWIATRQYWARAGGSHRDCRQQHVFSYHDEDGNEIGSFKCPRKDCEIQPTIQVQKAIDSKVGAGQILGNANILSPGERPPTLPKELIALFRHSQTVQTGMPCGVNRSVYAGRLHCWLLRKLGRPINQPVYINEGGYGCHMNIFGKSGKGKSTLIQQQFKWACEQNHGITILDPHGDLVRDCLKLIPKKRRDDVQLMRISDADNPLGCNVLNAHNEREAATIRSELMLAVKRLSQSWGDNIGLAISYGIETVQHVGGTLNDVYELFTRASTRDRYLRKLDPVADEELVDFWNNYDRCKAEFRASIKTKLRPIVKHPLLGRAMSAEHSVNPDEVIRDKKIVLIDLSTNDGDISDTVNHLFGTIIFIKWVSAAFRQLQLTDHERIRHFLVVDEAGSFMSDGMDYERVYSQARKVKFSLILACQSPLQLLNKVLDSMWDNAGVILSFAVSKKVAKVMADNVPGTTAEEFASQNRGECIVRINETLVYRIRTMLPQRSIEDQTQYVEQRMKALGVGEQKTVHLEPQLEADENELDPRFFAKLCTGVR